MGQEDRWGKKEGREMNKGIGFRPKNKLSSLCNSKGEGELTGSKKQMASFQRGTMLLFKTPAPNARRKWCKDIKMFFSFGFNIFLAVSKVQSEIFHLSLKKNSAKIWALGKHENLPGDPAWIQGWAIQRACLEKACRSPEPKAVPGSAQSQEDWESTAPAWWDLKTELGEHPARGACPEPWHLVTNK